MNASEHAKVWRGIAKEWAETGLLLRDDEIELKMCCAYNAHFAEEVAAAYERAGTILPPTEGT